jgi:ADP-ribosyl-[dinitrogen reductase] hydrolase
MYRYDVRERIRSGGYVIDCLYAALWAFSTTECFEDCVLKAVNLGVDADTTAAVAGQIAGSYYGFSKIPVHLKTGLARKDILDPIFENLI